MLKFHVALIALVSLFTFGMTDRSLAVENTRSIGESSSQSIDTQKVVLPTMTALLDTQTQLIRAKNLKKYTHANNLFSISIPSGWSKKDTSKPNDTIVTWYDQTGNALISVEVLKNRPGSNVRNNPDSLGKFLNKVVKFVVKDLKNPTIEDSVASNDGWVRIAWSGESIVNNQSILMRGNSFIRLDGDLISTYTDMIPNEQVDRLNPVLDKIVKSFTIK